MENKNSDIPALLTVWVGGALLTVLLLAGCSEQDLSSEAFHMGNDLVDSHTQLGYMDTLTVELSTVILDSVRTSATGRMLVGQYTDGAFGTVHASTCFQVTVPGTTVTSDAVFDSLTLVLDYDGYFYGDTLKSQTLQVYPLAEYPEADDNGYYYNTSPIPANETLLAQHTFTPRISDGSLEIRLQDAVGKEFFEKLQEGELGGEAAFLEDFPGIALNTLEDDAAVMGYAIEDSGAYLKLYYHRSLAEKETYTAHFYPTNTDDQFNRIQTDRSGTVLESWTRQRYPIPSTQTNEQVFVQGATGVLTRITFPTLNYFIELGKQGSLLKAELIFRPVKGTYTKHDVPDNTVLYQTDKYSAMGTEVYDTDAEVIQTGETYVDHQYHETTYIKFDVSEYFRYDFLDQYYDEQKGFLLGMLSPDYRSSLNRLVLSTQKGEGYKPMLRVYYILYQTE